MPAPRSQTEIINALKMLPPVLANFLASTDTTDAIEEIESNYSLDPTATLQLINAVSWFVSGFLSSKEMDTELQKIVPQNIAFQFKKDVIVKIFMPYAKEFRENGINFERIAHLEPLPETVTEPLTNTKSMTKDEPKPEAVPGPIAPESQLTGLQSTKIEPEPIPPPPESKPTPPPVIISAPPKPSPSVVPVPAARATPTPSSTPSPMSAPAAIPSLPPVPATTPATIIGTKISAALPRKPTEPQPATAPIPKPAPTPPRQTMPRSFALPRITIAAEKSKTPITPETEPIKKESEPLPIPRPVRYTTPQPIREIPKIISPHGMTDNRPTATTAPQPNISQPPPPLAPASSLPPSPMPSASPLPKTNQAPVFLPITPKPSAPLSPQVNLSQPIPAARIEVKPLSQESVLAKTIPVSAPISPASSPLKPQKSQSPIIDLSTFQVVNQVVNDETVRNATPIPNAPTAPITQPSQPTAKGNTIDLK